MFRILFGKILFFSFLREEATHSSCGNGSIISNLSSIFIFTLKDCLLLLRFEDMSFFEEVSASGYLLFFDSVFFNVVFECTLNTVVFEEIFFPCSDETLFEIIRKCTSRASSLSFFAEILFRFIEFLA